MVAGTIIFRDVVAHFVWQKWRMGAPAIMLDAHDAPLAMKIGNYYFGSAPVGDSIPAYDPQIAERAFSKALAIQPGILWAHYSLARIAFARGDFATALEEVNAELAANPENLRSLYVRGLIYGFRGFAGDLALAEADLRAFVAWAPAEWAGYNDLAWILLREGKYAETISVVDSASQKVPKALQNPWLLNDRGLALLNLDRMSEAKVAFEQAREYAAELTSADWRRAYSGNDPMSAADGLTAFRAGIEQNLQKAGGGS